MRIVRDALRPYAGLRFSFSHATVCDVTISSSIRGAVDENNLTSIFAHRYNRWTVGRSSPGAARHGQGANLSAGLKCASAGATCDPSA
jgi:hypothetical protein